MATMSREDHVIVRQVRHNADRHSLLPDGQVGWALHLVLVVLLRDALLHHTDEEHGPVRAKQIIFFHHLSQPSVLKNRSVKRPKRTLRDSIEIVNALRLFIKLGCTTLL